MQWGESNGSPFFYAVYRELNNRIRVFGPNIVTYTTNDSNFILTTYILKTMKMFNHALRQLGVKNESHGCNQRSYSKQCHRAII